MPRRPATSTAVASVHTSGAAMRGIESHTVEATGGAGQFASWIGLIDGADGRGRVSKRAPPCPAGEERLLSPLPMADARAHSTVRTAKSFAFAIGRLPALS
jgi:hypothetical protein